MGYIPNRIIPKRGSFKELNVDLYKDKIILYSKRCRKKIRLSKKIGLTEDDIVGIGLYLSEGQKYVNFGRSYNHSGEIDFSNGQLVCFKPFLSLMSKFGIFSRDFKWRIDLNINYSYMREIDLTNYWVDNLDLEVMNSRPRRIYYTGKKRTKLTSLNSKYGCLHILYSSVIFRNFLLNFVNRFLEDSIRTKDKRVLSLILKGYFGGDGSINFNREKRRRQVYFCCNDKVLFSMIRKSLQIIGLKSIRETHPEYTKTHTKSIMINNRKDFDILNFHHIPYLIPYKQKKFYDLINSYNYVPLRGFEPRMSSS